MSTFRTHRVLLAEDEPIIALNLEMALEEAGYSVVGPFQSCGEALAAATTETLDCAVVDFNLADGDCTGALETLIRRHIPFVITTGLRDQDLGEAIPRGTPILPKPFRTEQLLAQLRRLEAQSTLRRSRLASHGATYRSGAPLDDVQGDARPAAWRRPGGLSSRIRSTSQEDSGTLRSCSRWPVCAVPN